MSHGKLFEKNFLETQLGSLIKKPINTITKDHSINKAINRLCADSSGSVTITDSSNKPIGILTERDILKRVSITGHELDSTKVESIITKDPQTLKYNASLARAMYIMATGKFRHIPVTDKTGALLGMLSVKEIIDFLYEHIAKKVLEQHGEPLEDTSNAIELFSGDITFLKPLNPIKIREDATIEEASSKLKTSKLGVVTICDEHNKIKGIFTERDYLRRVAITQMDRASEKITYVMTPSPTTILENSSISIAFQMFSEGGFRHLPVVNYLEEITGIITVENFITVLSNEILEELST